MAVPGMDNVDPEAIFQHGGAFEEHGDRLNRVVANWQVHLEHIAGVAATTSTGTSSTRATSPG